MTDTRSPGQRPEIVLQNSRTYPELRAREIRKWLGDVVGELAPDTSSLGVRFSGLRAMAELNDRFRGRKAATDVLSFPGEGSAGHLGDIVICVPEAARQGRSRRHRLAREIRLLLLHGCLHCLGYDHETDSGEMEALEKRLRRRWLEPR